MGATSYFLFPVGPCNTSLHSSYGSLIIKELQKLRGSGGGGYKKQSDLEEGLIERTVVVSVHIL